MNFRRKSEIEQANLTDEELIAYAVDARKADQHDTFTAAVREFVGRRMGLVSYWVSKKAHGFEAEEIVGNALASMITSADKIKGSSAGEMVEWMRAVTARRIADYYRAKEKDPTMVPIDDQPADDGEWVEPTGGAPDETGRVEVRILLEQVLAGLDEVKREVFEMRIAGYTAKETAELSRDPGMTPANVDQIFSRCKKKLSKELWD